MGVDKTLLTVEGRALVARVCDAVGSVCAETLVVTNRPEALAEAGLPPEVRIAQDEVAYQGPLGGLVTAMRTAAREWVLAVAADMPHLEPGIVEALWSLTDGGDVVVPVTERGPEPLLALYRVPACLGPASEALATGRRRIVAFYPRVRVVEVPVDALRRADPELRSLVNVNTPLDLLAAEDALESPGADGERPVRCERAEGERMPSERPVTIHLNETEVATVQATPSDLEELAVGFLVAEGLLTDRAALTRIDVDAKRGLVWVVTEEPVPADLAARTRYLTSGCGRGVTFASVGHARGLEPVDAGPTVEADALYRLIGEMAREAVRYRRTGGMHACGLARDGRLLLVREDVGRHNALDKLLGRAWLDATPTHDAVLLTTGRISYEMAVKAAKARVPIVVSRSAVTDLAAEVAGSLGITLVGYARGGRLTVYTHPRRIAGAPGGASDG